MIEIVRVFRLIEYVGARSQVEEQIRKSVHGSRSGITGVVITANTLGEFPTPIDDASALATALQQVVALKQAMEADRANYEYRLAQMEEADESYNAQGRPGEHQQIRDSKDDHK